MGELSNQTAVITGGGTGIGFAIAERFHREGAFVVLSGRRAEVLQEAARRISLAAERVAIVDADVTDEQQVARLIEQAASNTGRIDILVNNAGPMRVHKAPEDTSLEEFRQAIDTNIVGAFLCAREAGKLMIRQKSGRIINMSSMSGSIVNRYVHGGSYEISKAGMNMLTKTLAVEWAKHGIRVNAIAPGYYATKPNEAYFAAHPEAAHQILELIPTGKFGALDELARLAVLLASPNTDYMTGSILTIDGGYTVW
ncbi:MAG: SDR family oxidoreductase [Bryobacterales bacterium]|nr:SDR family oxidoreductase [Bryobacterales bacterium]